MHQSPFPPNSQWISSPVRGGARSVPPAPYFRNLFTLPSNPAKALLHITALGLYETEINGHRVGDHIFAPGWTDYRVRVPFQTYDVTAFLTQGENVLGVILGDGWYSGHVGEKDRQFYGERPQVLARLEVTLQNGTSFICETDGTWKTTTGPILENDMIMGEAYDARLELGAWSSPGFDDKTWQPAIAAETPAISIVPQLGPPVRRHELIPGVRVEKSKKQIYDLQQNITGRLRIKVRGKAGVTLRLRHAEILDEKGGLYTENLRGARAVDYYTLKGCNSTETYEPRFTFHGFRFFEISWQGKPEDVVVESAEGVVLHSDTARTGWFQCSNPLLNQLASNILWGQKGNFLEVPTDCPQRDERLGWTGDAQVFVRTAAFQMNVQSFFHKWLQDMRDAQGSNGAIPPVVPSTDSFGLPSDGGPAWADAVCICPWTIYQCYGDVNILRDHYATMVGYMEYLSTDKVKDGIRCHPEKDSWGGFGDWLALDGKDVFGHTRKDLIGTAFYANNARILAETAALLGKSEDESKWKSLRQEIVTAFQKRFVTPDGLIAGSTQTSYVLALHFDLLPESSRGTAAGELVSMLKARDYHLSTGFVGTPYLLHVLEKSGHLDVAYRLLEQETYPSWIFPVKNGATTIWERWDGWTPERGPQDKGMNSYNHYAYGAVGDWMVSTVAGLEIGAPGYKQILFKPRPGGSITSASAKLETPHGMVSIAWKLEDDALKLDLEVPTGCEARLDLPSEYENPTTHFAAGQHKVACILTSALQRVAQSGS